MAYVKTVWTEGVTPCDKTNMDHLETQYDEAVATAVAADAVVAAAAGKVSSGSYTGDGTASKAVAHGLGRVPLLVHIACIHDQYKFSIIDNNIFASSYAEDGVNACPSSTTATNFYVGGATNVSKFANKLTQTYKWVAIG